jgi:hypothetical protein
MIFNPIDSRTLICVKRLGTMKIHLDKVVHHLLYGERGTIPNGSGIRLSACRLPYGCHD